MRNTLNVLFKPKVKKIENPFQAQKCLFDKAVGVVIFDIGAYIGEVASLYKKFFPQSTIYCFEPFPDSFQKLNKSLRDKSIHAYQIAFSDAAGKAILYINADPSCNSFFPRPQNKFKYYSEKSENVDKIQVETNTLDAFCTKTKISIIDILKLDVEGAEIKVLKGASRLLSEQAIRLIYTEATFVHHYEGGCLFHELASFLSHYNYSLFNFYNLKRARSGQLRWGNSIFISPEFRTVIENHK